MAVRRLNELRPAEVRIDPVTTRPAAVRWQSHSNPHGAPRTSDVEHVLDVWYVDDGWWTGEPVRRLYHECQLADGGRLVLVHDLRTGTWHVQR